MFRFSISNVGTFLGKSPVTIRAWERKGLIELPRVGANRALDIHQLLAVANRAYDLGRISEDRLEQIKAAWAALSMLEWEDK